MLVRSPMLMRLAVAGVLFAMSPAPAAFADEYVPATAEEYKAKIRVFTDRAKKYRQEAEENREIARRYRDVRNSKGRKITTAQHKELADKFDAMAADDEKLAVDAEQIAALYEKRLKALKKSK